MLLLHLIKKWHSAGLQLEGSMLKSTFCHEAQELTLGQSPSPEVGIVMPSNTLGFSFYLLQLIWQWQGTIGIQNIWMTLIFQPLSYKIQVLHMREMVTVILGLNYNKYFIIIYYLIILNLFMLTECFSWWSGH